MPMFDLCMNGDAHLWNQFPGPDRGRIFFYGSPKDGRLMRLFFQWTPDLKPVSQHGSRRGMPLLCAGSSLAAESTR